CLAQGRAASVEDAPIQEHEAAPEGSLNGLLLERKRIRPPFRRCSLWTAGRIPVRPGDRGIPTASWAPQLLREGDRSCPSQVRRLPDGGVRHPGDSRELIERLPRTPAEERETRRRVDYHRSAMNS